MTKLHLIILPGWEQDRSHWQSVLSKLETVTAVRVLELPGFGSEPLIDDNWGVPEYTQWVYQKLQQLPSTRDFAEPNLIFLGHSFGGRVAHYLACKYQPQWLKGLILYAAPILYRPNWLTRLQNYLSKVGNFLGLLKLVPNRIKKLFYSDDLQRSQQSGKEKILRQVVAFDQTDFLTQNTYPTVLLWGEQDSVVPLNMAKELHAKLSHSRLIVLPKQGHHFHLTNPTLFYGTIKQILELYF